MTSKDTELALLVGCQRRENTYHITTTSIVQLIDGDRLRNLDHYHELNHISVRGQQSDTNDACYGYGVEYQASTGLDLAEARRAVKVLTAIENKLARLNAELGYPESYAAYIARLAKVLGIKRIVWATSQGGWSYDDNTYHIANIADGIGYIRHIQATWATEHAKTAS